jgi:hypothetical protein
VLKRIAAWLAERFTSQRSRGLGGWTSRADGEGNVRILPGSPR